jgi:tetratricopeptide (TPR) repeat protein/predicted Ser/Thr protein kinase
MTADRFRHLQQIFHDALSHPAGPDRERFLAAQCDGDSEMLALAADLIQADGAATGPAPATAPDLPAFGVFQADRILGRGGMGVVYLAHRTDGQFEQLAAVKVIQAGQISTPAYDSFLRERRILAKLHHPGIAQLLDGGFCADGTPYLVMEYVEGERLDDYCRLQRLDIRSRLALFRGVCAAVSFAHRSLIVHRDLKPSNIFVTQRGDPKLLDFGTAKLVTGDDSSATQVMVTPRYGSPEQLRGEFAGVQSDVYSLGIILAELLTGRWPFGDPESRIETMRRAVEDVMPSPLTAALTVEHADACRASVRQLRAVLGGDLGAIVMKALENDAERRYHSVDELSQDLGRFLDGKPVSACPPTFAYRSVKFLRRHWLACAAASLAVAAIAAGVIGTVQERRIAERRFQDVRSIAGYMLTELDDQLAQLPASTPVRASMSERSMQYLDALRRQAGSDVGLRLEIADGYLRLGNVLGNLFRSNVGRPREARIAYDHGRDTARDLIRDRPSDPAPRRILARIEMNAALMQSLDTGGTAADLDRATRAIDTLEHLAPASPESAADHHDLGRAYMYSAVVRVQKGGVVGNSSGTAHEMERAEKHLKRATELDPADPEYRMSLADLYQRKAIANGTADPKASLEDFDRAIALFYTLSPPAQNSMARRYWLARVIQAKAWPLGQLQRYDEAFQLLEQARPVMEQYAAMDPDNLRPRFDMTGFLRTWGIIANYAGKKREAIARFEADLKIYDGFPELTDTLKYLRSELLQRIASLHTDLGEHDAAAVRARECAAALRPLADKPESPASYSLTLAEVLNGSVARQLRDLPAAIYYAERAVSKSPDNVAINEILAECYHLDGRRDNALKALDHALALTPAPKPGEPLGRSRAGIMKKLGEYRK